MRNRKTPETIISKIFAKAQKAMAKPKAVKKTIGRQELTVLPQDYEVFADELVKTLYESHYKKVAAYCQAEAEEKAILEAGLEKINQMTGGRLSLADSWKFTTLDGLVSIANENNETPTITPYLVEARKQFNEFLDKYNIRKDKLHAPFIDMSELAFTAIDRDIAPRPQDIKKLASALGKFKDFNMPEAAEIQKLLMNGWEVKKDKRELRIRHREDMQSPARTISIRNYRNEEIKNATE